MYRGFLGYDASLMLDVVVCALVLVVPILCYSIWAVKFRQKYHLHKKLQILLSLLLFVAVVLFEIDMQLHGGWQAIINKDPSEPRMSPEELSEVAQVLYIHLVFAISTPFLWGWTMFEALRKFPRPVTPARHSRKHAFLGWASAIDLTMTSITGLIFYYFAFVR